MSSERLADSAVTCVYALLTGIDILIRFKSIVGLYIVSSSFI